MKLHGKEIPRRGSYNKYDEIIGDLDQLHEDLKVNTMSELAKIKGVPANSIRHLLYAKDKDGKYIYPREWMADIKKGRSFHTNFSRKSK